MRPASLVFFMLLVLILSTNAFAWGLSDKNAQGKRVTFSKELVLDRGKAVSCGKSCTKLSVDYVFMADDNVEIICSLNGPDFINQFIKDKKDIPYKFQAQGYFLFDEGQIDGQQITHINGFPADLSSTCRVNNSGFSLEEKLLGIKPKKETAPRPR